MIRSISIRAAFSLCCAAVRIFTKTLRDFAGRKCTAVSKSVVLAAVFRVALLCASGELTFAQGDILWKNNFGGYYTDLYVAIAATSDGGTVAVGCSEYGSFGTGDLAGVTGKGNYDAIIVLHDGSGNAAWKRNFGGSDFDSFTGVTVAPDGGIVAVGCSASGSFENGDWSDVTSFGDTDATIVKFSSDGASVLWKSNFGGSGSDQFSSVITVSDGFIAIGYSEVASFGSGDWTGVTAKGKDSNGIIVKYSLNGVKQWQKNFGGAGDFFQSAVAVSDGFIVCGYCSEFLIDDGGDWTGFTSNGWFDATIIKFDNSGNVVWKNIFGGAGQDSFVGLTLVSDGIVAVGYSSDTSFGTGNLTGVTGYGNTDAIIVKYSFAGMLQWKTNFGGSAGDSFQSVTAGSDGFVAVGYSDPGSFGTGAWTGITGKGYTDAIAVKFNNEGVVQWKKNVGGDGNDYYQDVITVKNDIIAAGQAQGISTGDWAGLTSNGQWEAIIVRHNAAFNPVFSGGDGTSTNPYRISSAADLVALRTYTNDDLGNTFGKYYVLTNDISLESFADWTPIGSSISTAFNGNFDGSNFKISGLKITSNHDNYNGLFGFLGSGYVKNLGVKDVNIVFNTGNVTGVSVQVYAGGVVGCIQGTTGTTVSNCYVTGRISVSQTDAGGYCIAGGVAGIIDRDNIVSNCYTTVAVETIATKEMHRVYAGGIAGYNVGSISNCYATGAIKSISNNNVAFAGGIAGICDEYASASNCVALNPDIVCTSSLPPYVGRIVGLYNVYGASLSSNIAFGGMLLNGASTSWENVGASEIDGADLTRLDSDCTFGGRFTADNGFTVEYGELPGLFGSTVAVPEHLLSVPFVVGADTPNSCELYDDSNVKVGTTYSFNDALTAALANNNYTVKLLSDVTVSSTVSVSVGKTVTFDLDGLHTLTVNATGESVYGYGLSVNGGSEVKLKNEALGKAEFNVYGKTSGASVQNGSKAAVSNATITGTSSAGGYVVYATGVSSGVRSTVTVSGNVTDNGVNTGVYCQNGATVTVGGNVNSGSTGITSRSSSSGGVISSVDVGGNITAGGYGVNVQLGATAAVAGNVTSNGYNGVNLTGSDCTAKIGGNVTVINVTSDAYGVRCGSSSDTNGKVTVGGTITSSSSYISLGGVVVTASGYNAVSDKPGYRQYNVSGETNYVWVRNPSIASTSVTFTAEQVNGSSNTANSTDIKLTFSAAVTDLMAGNITITNGTGAAVKGALTGSGTIWTIALTSVTAQGDVTVSVSNFGTFTVSNNPRTVAVYKAPTSVTFTAVQKGGSSNTANSTGIEITFSKAVTGLSETDITIVNGTGTVTKGALTGSGTTWTIALTDVGAQGEVTVSVANFDAYIVTTTQQTVDVYKYKYIPPPPVTFTAKQIGGSSGTANSTGIELSFSAAVTSLSASDITITNGTGTVTKGALTGSGTTWTIALASVCAQGDVSVSVANFGSYTFGNNPQTVTVYKDASIQLTFTVAQTGGASRTANSTGIVITFNTAVTGLSASDITIINGTGTVAKGALSGSGSVYTIELTGIGEEGNVTVSVKNFGAYIVATAQQTVTVYKEYSSIATYTVTFSVAGGNGTLQARANDAAIFTGAAVNDGTDVIFTAIPNNGYSVKEWTVNGVPASNNTTNSYTLTGVAANTTVTVEFESVTGISEMPNVNQLTAWMRNGILHVEGLTAGKPLSIYSASGILIYQSIAVSETADIALNVHGVYIVQSEERTVKIIRIY